MSAAVCNIVGEIVAMRSVRTLLRPASIEELTKTKCRLRIRILLHNIASNEHLEEYDPSGMDVAALRVGQLRLDWGHPSLRHFVFVDFGIGVETKWV